MKKRVYILLLTAVFIVGLALLLYPSFSDYWNSIHQSRAIADYAEKVKTMDGQKYDKIWQEASEYNSKLNNRNNLFSLSDEERAVYSSTLDIGGTGIMGYIEIPAISVRLPIYHGVDDGILEIGIGHIEWSSLPVGGENSHCVISGHRGLASSTLFTNIDKLKEGDLFMLRVLDEVLSYRVDLISIVEPEDTEKLMPQKGKDLCTLVTCTPYGVNTHRLLVRGHRVETKEAETVFITSDALQTDPLIVAAVIAFPAILIIFTVIMIPKGKSHTKQKKKS